MNIKPSTVTPERLFNGITTRYQVPHYQRDYAWTEDNLGELWNDVHSASKKGGPYFLGSIVLSGEGQKGHDNERWDIVDGQQRLATLTILFATIRDLAQSYIKNSLDPAFKDLLSQQSTNTEKAKRIDTIASSLIVRIGSPDNYFLELNDKDQTAFYKIQCPSPALIQESDWRFTPKEKRVNKAKIFFARSIFRMFMKEENGFVALEQFLMFCMTKLLLLRIEVETDSDAYLLFESLNDRGLDLSIADLVKNRLLVACGTDADRKKRILSKWDAMTDTLKESRYPLQEFLRFYWAAFHESVTKKELYAHVKEHLLNHEVEHLVDSLVTSCSYFSQVTKRALRYPAGIEAPESINQRYGEINTLGYSVCYPLFLWCFKNREELLVELVPVSLAYLFRLITVANFAANRAEGAFNKALSLLRKEPSTSLGEVLLSFKDEELQDERFMQRLKASRFEDNKTARYLLSRIHDKFDGGTALRLTKEAQLEHVLPVSELAWPTFDVKGRDRTDWVYNLGNMTLLESSLNQSLQDSDFNKKAKFYKEKSGQTADEAKSAIPMTQRIYDEYTSSGKKWNVAWIQERADHFATKATAVWQIPPTLQ